MNRYLTDSELLQRQQRARLVYSLTTVIVCVTALYLLWALPADRATDVRRGFEARASEIWGVTVEVDLPAGW